MTKDFSARTVAFVALIVIGLSYPIWSVDDPVKPLKILQQQRLKSVFLYIGTNCLNNTLAQYVTATASLDQNGLSLRRNKGRYREGVYNSFGAGVPNEVMPECQIKPEILKRHGFAIYKGQQMSRLSHLYKVGKREITADKWWTPWLLIDEDVLARIDNDKSLSQKDFEYLVNANDQIRDSFGLAQKEAGHKAKIERLSQDKEVLIKADIGRK